MERGLLLGILHAMKGTDKELHICLQSEEAPVAIQKLVDVEALHSPADIRTSMRQNNIWLGTRHVSPACQARRADD